MKYLIFMGLPASGKTDFAKAYKESKVEYTGDWYNKKRICPVFIMDIDSKFKNGNKSLETIICNYCREIDYSIKEVIIDGLFTTNKDIIDVINNLDNNSSDIIEIHYWEENREQCLINDKYRRDENSEISIKNIPFEKVDIDLIEKETKIRISVINHDVSIKPQWKIFSDKYDLYLQDDEYIKSEKWSLGGTWCNCWGDSGNVSAESPVEFTEFDELLSQVCPNISFLNYKKLFRECVETDEYSDRDYYGGSVDYAYYKCNIENLYDKLIEMNLIEEEND